MSTAINILFLSANPKKALRVDVEEAMHAIEQNVRASDHRDSLIFQPALASRPDDLLQMLNQHRPHIVHFSGTGSEKGLSFVGADGRVRPVSPKALTNLFAILKDNIQLIFLDACYSPVQAQALAAIIDCVITMKATLTNESRIAFASSFYRAIGFGRSIQEAFEQGKTSLLLENLPGDDIPELLHKGNIDPGQIVLVAPRNPQWAWRSKPAPHPQAVSRCRATYGIFPMHATLFSPVEKISCCDWNKHCTLIESLPYLSHRPLTALVASAKHKLR
jgi:hypothetical protein